MKKRVILIISVLLAITAVTAFVYCASRDKTESGTLLIKTASGDITVDINDLDLSDVKGEVKNNKGEIKTIDAMGYPVADIPSLAGTANYSEITVYSDDEYHAVLSEDELKDRSSAWLITDEGALRLIVFGDGDSKRNVKNITRIEIR